MALDAVRTRLRLRRALREHVVVGARFTLADRCSIWAPASLSIGDDVALGSDVRIEVDGTIGDAVLIANRVGIVGRRDHDVRTPGRTVREGRWVGEHADLSLPVAIGSDVWIGYGATVLSGVVIGDSAVVGAGAVVRDDVPAGAVVAGNPAVVVGARFPSEEAFAEHWRLLAARGLRRLPQVSHDRGPAAAR